MFQVTNHLDHVLSCVSLALNTDWIAVGLFSLFVVSVQCRVSFTAWGLQTMCDLL